MSFSGIRVRDEVVTEFNTMKLRHSFRYIQMKISDDEKWIEIEKVSPTDSTTYAEFVEQLPRKDCRYVIYDFPYETESSGQQEKLVFFLWWADICFFFSCLYEYVIHAWSEPFIGGV